MPRKPEGTIAGIVLAAGASTRMGRNKLFLDIGGEPAVRRAVRQAVDAGLEPVIVVAGHESERTAQAVADLRCTVVLNVDYARGINSSVRTGIRAVPPGADGAVVVLADMPLVTASMIATLVERYRSCPAALVVSRYGDVTAPPTLYDRTLFTELLTAEGEGCGKQVVKRHREEAEMVSWPPDALADFDVPDEYERIKTLVEEGGGVHAR